MPIASTPGLVGDPQPVAAGTLEPPPSHPFHDTVLRRHARAIVRLAFGKPENRNFSVRYSDGSVDVAGRSPLFTLVLPHPWSLRAMFWPPAESRVAEAYIAGAFDVEGDLEAATALAGLVRDRLCRVGTLLELARHALALPAPPGAARSVPTRRPHGRSIGHRHSPGRDSAAVRSHYDVGNDFYALWLDRRMVYSCAYYTQADESIDDAQRDKLEHLCRKLRLRPDETLLDVGCGWGALVIHAAKYHGVRATGITLSPPQAELARQRVREAGLEDRVRIAVCDYRQLAAAPDTKPFDKIVSVGMFEHVGPQQMAVYFRSMYALLRPGGLFMNHGIVEEPYRRIHGWRGALRRILWRPGSFIDRDVFPDGDLVPLGFEVSTAEDAGFETRDVESLRRHYVRTLREWVRRLDLRYADAVRLTSEATARTWRLYMSASAHAFASAQIGLCQVLFARPDTTGATRLPLTREDLYPAGGSAPPSSMVQSASLF